MKILIIFILISCKFFSQKESKIYICTITYISELKFEKEVYYFETIFKSRKCS